MDKKNVESNRLTVRLQPDEKIEAEDRKYCSGTWGCPANAGGEQGL